LGSSTEGLLSASVEAVGTRLGWLNFLNKRENDIGIVQKSPHTGARGLVLGDNCERCGEAKGEMMR
jgi:hypothetical protein